MSETNTCYQDIEKKIGSLKEKMGIKTAVSYDLDLFTRMAKRIAGFSHTCEECQNYKDQVSNGIIGLIDWPDATREQKETYDKTLRITLKHLVEHHGLRMSKKHWGWLMIIVAIVFFILGFYLGTSEYYGGGGKEGLGIASFVIGIVLFILSFFMRKSSKDI